jgi:predicted nuclease of restriction endonuclease-like (RecB) superfamily
MTARSLAKDEYISWLGDMKSRILSARQVAARSVNKELILLYWDIGRGIVEKQDQLAWGEGIVDRLSRDLARAFPDSKGFSSRNLRDMKRFFKAYSHPEIWRQAVAELAQSTLKFVKRRQRVAKMSDPEIIKELQQHVAEIPWGHNLVILNKIAEPSARLYYLRATAQCAWTRKVLFLCAEKDDLEVEFALKSKTNPIGVAEYQLKTTLPKALRGKLPSPQDLSRALGLPPKRPRR